ncbi:MAG: hypothetical protein M0P12_01320 [Paludibacteraceae bacterium]|nr:hypothetical protein [Paludibacteraceae bacterium]MCK9615524.1 hypothetical protein [Candidatus Omnitrophota bacterium]
MRRTIKEWWDNPEYHSMTVDDKIAAWAEHCKEVERQLQATRDALCEAKPDFLPTPEVGAVSMSPSTSLLADLRGLVETWRTERDFLSTGEGADRTAANVYDECAWQAMELIKTNT